MVLGLSFLLLLVAFRSIVVPALAIGLNLLSVGAAYGLLVLVAQEGVGADLLGFQTSDAIESWLPLFLFSVLFGLSMDYHVFLLSRIRERYEETGDSTESVALRHPHQRPPHHRRGADHGRGVRRLRGGRPGHVPADGLRPRRRRPDRRDARADAAPAGGHDAARPLELVPPALARVAAATSPSRARRRRPGRSPRRRPRSPPPRSPQPSGCASSPSARSRSPR